MISQYKDITLSASHSLSSLLTSMRQDIKATHYNDMKIQRHENTKISGSQDMIAP